MTKLIGRLGAGTLALAVLLLACSSGSAAGSRTTVDNPREESQPPAQETSVAGPSAQTDGTISGLIPNSGGGALVVWSGGPLSDLLEVAAAQACDIQSLWVTDAAGRFVFNIVGAPDFVNEAWADRFPGGRLPARSPYILICNATGTPTIEPLTPPPPAGAPSLTGDLPASGGFGLVVWSGGHPDGIVTVANERGCDVSAVWSNNGAGDFISYISGAPDAANAAWFNRFPDGSMPGDSAVVVACRAPDDLAGMSLQEKAGQLIFAGIPGTEVGDTARHLFNDLHIGNIVLMGANAGTPAQVAALTAGLQQLAIDSNGVGALIATDQEGGTVQRLIDGFTDLPDARTIGEAGDPDLARQYGAMIGSELRAVGVNMALAPVLDVNDNPDNPVIGRRAFGTTPDAVINVALPFIEGLRRANVIATGKHFPGHGSTETDSHFTLPVVKKTVAELEATELAPFRAAVQEGIGAVMVAHVAYPALDASGIPASISEPIVTGVLRQELGFDGVVVTDDMAMAGITGQAPPAQSSVQAIAAGADIVICVSLPCDPATTQAAIIDAVNSGALSMARLDEAVRHVLALKQAFDVAAGASGDITAVGSAEHRALVDQIVQRAGS